MHGVRGNPIVAIEPKTKIAIAVALVVPLAAFVVQGVLQGWDADWQFIGNWLLGTSPQIAITAIALVFGLAQSRLRAALVVTTVLFLLFEFTIATSLDPNSAMLWAFYFPAAGFVFLLAVILPTKRNAKTHQGP